MATDVILGDHTNAVLAAITAGTGKPTGELDAPDAGGWQGEWGASDFVPYSVITLDDVAFSGPISDAQADGAFIYRFVSVGTSPRQAMWLSDRLRASVNKASITAQGIPNRKVMGTVFADQQGVQKDQSVQPPLYYVVDSYTLLTTPAA